MTKALVWLRHDLRLDDNPALFEACLAHQSVLVLYILEDHQNSCLGEAQTWWLHHSLDALRLRLKQKGLQLTLRKGAPLEIILELLDSHSIDVVYWNRRYTPAGIACDKKLKSCLHEKGIDVQSFQANLLHEPWTILNKQGDFFKVFTAYWKTCRQKLAALSCKPQQQITVWPKSIDAKSDHLIDWGLLPKLNWASAFSQHWTPGEEGAQLRLRQFIDTRLTGYKHNRDFPIQDATSRLSPHLHFGEMSPYRIVYAVEQAMLNPSVDLVSAEHFLSELGWREFSAYLLYHFPDLPTRSFKPAFDNFPWKYDRDVDLIRWQKGMTGYPIVDAGMRELWETGYMHNRVRMIVASFLTKSLLIDWRLGADWFLDTLLDADLANNSASWQWVAGCGADAAPYFRIFNPVLQSEKFDSSGAYLKRWLPELAVLDSKSIHAPWTSSSALSVYVKKVYPKPMVDHQMARLDALNAYQSILK